MPLKKTCFFLGGELVGGGEQGKLEYVERGAIFSKSRQMTSGDDDGPPQKESRPKPKPKSAS